jgi:hypothetical protein
MLKTSHIDMSGRLQPEYYALLQGVRLLLVATGTRNMRMVHTQQDKTGVGPVGSVWQRGGNRLGEPCLNSGIHGMYAEQLVGMIQRATHELAGPGSSQQLRRNCAAFQCAAHGCASSWYSCGFHPLSNHAACHGNRVDWLTTTQEKPDKRVKWQLSVAVMIRHACLLPPPVPLWALNYRAHGQEVQS